jgi:cytochrome c biogenesis protein
MNRLWRILIGKKTAVTLMGLFTVLLGISALLPSELYSSALNWNRLRLERPVLFWISDRFTTTDLVRHPVFIALSTFLFASTLSCTVNRVLTWRRMRRMEFVKEKAINVRAEAWAEDSSADLAGRIVERLGKAGWECREEAGTIAAERGLRAGLWGSVVFHLGLIILFLAPLVTALTIYRTNITLTDDIPIRYEDAVVAREGIGGEDLKGTMVEVRGLWGDYYKGEYKVNFGGTLAIGGREVPFSVNNSVEYKGYTFAMRKFGFSPEVMIEKDGREVFSYFLNLIEADEGDYFPFGPEGEAATDSLLVLFFPDFVRGGEKGERLGTASKEAKNPALLVRFMKEGNPLHKGLLLRPGEAEEFMGYRVRFGELRHWTTLIVSREWGMGTAIVGFMIGLPGLFVRFLSNERRVEFALGEDGERGGTRVRVSGFSRYYPAFLEREVAEMAGAVGVVDISPEEEGPRV